MENQHGELKQMKTTHLFTATEGLEHMRKANCALKLPANKEEGMSVSNGDNCQLMKGKIPAPARTLAPHRKAARILTLRTNGDRLKYSTITETSKKEKPYFMAASLNGPSSDADSSCSCAS